MIIKLVLSQIKNDIQPHINRKNNGYIFNIYIPSISVAIVAGLFVMALLNFSAVRKNMQKQSEQQIKSLKIQSGQQIRYIPE
jgi:high-affinity Fe2+/Pb2+ permease